jgi:polyisoprenoid-binding protein YceI
MRSLVTGFIALTVGAFAVPARASVWEIDAMHSSAGFSVKHMMVSNVKGTFGKVTGTLDLNDKDPIKSTVNVSIDASTINTNEPKRDAHLKSPDFFDVAKYPTITFKSTKVEKAGKAKFKVTGELSMHGVTKPVVLTVEGPTPEMKNSMMNTFSRGASATGKINRKDWGLTWNKPLESAGGVLVGDDVSLAIDVELLKKAETTAAATPPPAPATPPPAAPAAPKAK